MNRSSVILGTVLTLSASPVKPCPNDEARTAPVGGYVKKNGAYLPPLWLRQPLARRDTLARDARPRRHSFMPVQGTSGILTGGSQNR